MPNIFEELLNKLPIENLFIFRFGKTEMKLNVIGLAAISYIRRKYQKIILILGQCFFMLCHRIGLDRTQQEQQQLNANINRHT